MCNLDAHAKEKYQKVTLFLTAPAATKLWEQFRWLHVGSLCRFRHCRIPKSDHSTLNHSPGIFDTFQLMLVQEAKNETDGMVTSPVQLSHLSWAKNCYLTHPQSSSFRSYRGNQKSSPFFQAQSGGCKSVCPQQMSPRENRFTCCSTEDQEKRCGAHSSMGQQRLEEHVFFGWR